jgi:cysteinyl-tRNA synthetase
MNITDVDDKIILKARRNHLLKQFFASPPPASDVLDRVRHGILSATTKLQVLAALPLTPHLLTIRVPEQAGKADRRESARRRRRRRRVEVCKQAGAMCPWRWLPHSLFTLLLPHR